MLTFGEEALIVEVRYAQEHNHANAKARRRLRLLIGGNIR